MTHIPFPPTARMVCISDQSTALPSFFPDEGGAAGSLQGGFAGAWAPPSPAWEDSVQGPETLDRGEDAERPPASVSLSSP